MSASTFRLLRAFYRLGWLFSILGPQGVALFLILAGKDGRAAMIWRALLSLVF